MPEYKQRMVQEEMVMWEVKRWSTQSKASLLDDLSNIEWNMFQSNSVYVSKFTEVVASFVAIMMKNAPTTAYISEFISGEEEYQAVSNRVEDIKNAKLHHRDRVESQFQQHDSSCMWQEAADYNGL